MIVEFKKEDEVYIAKTVLAFGGSEDPEKVMKRVRNAWLNGKDSKN